MEKNIFIQKVRAFSYHLGITIIVALISLMLVYKIWYPSPLAKATGVNNIYFLVLIVDVILGPILTFIVFKKPKKTLKFDLAIIGFLQISALVYGLYTVYMGKPAYDVDRFQLVRMGEIDQREIAKANSVYQHAPKFSPIYVTSIFPKNDGKIVQQVTMDEILHDISPAQKPQFYQPIERAYPLILNRAKSLAELNQYNDPIQVKNTLSKYPQADSFVPLKANTVNMTVLIDKKHGGKVVKIVDLRPWK